MAFVIQESKRDDLFTRANSIAFSFFLSIFPSLLMLFTLVPFVLNFLTIWFPDLANFNRTLFDEISRIMPGQAGLTIFGFIQEITSQPKVGLLSFGFLLAIYFSSNGMLAMMNSFDKVYAKTFRQRGALRKRMVAIGLTGLLGLFLVASSFLVILGDNIIRWATGLINLSQAAAVLIDVSRWIIMLALYYFTIGSLYRYGAATKKRFSYFSPGVTMAALLSLATSVAFSFYVDEFNRYDTYTKFYGSIATIIIIMLWLQLNALILLIGFELNASIAVNRDLRELDPEKGLKPISEREEKRAPKVEWLEEE
ncbi:ribonuclease BN [Lewinellaceae bacterium SD302]|nr:ribonuclease BN [Lewinellaceae bacterium SD302]